MWKAALSDLAVNIFLLFINMVTSTALILGSLTRPILSVVVPTLNEESCIGSFIQRMSAELSSGVSSWELVVVDDGSSDRTREIVKLAAHEDPRIRLIALAHYGKGAAVRRGLLAARGDWRFMADADLAMPPNNLTRFLSATGLNPKPAVIIGSREAYGAQRIGEPWFRYILSRLFNYVVRVCAVPGIKDTQCGFKMLSAEAVQRIVPLMTIDGFAFDVEMLHLARKFGFLIREVGIVWHGRTDSRVEFFGGMSAFLDVLRIGFFRSRLK